MQLRYLEGDIRGRFVFEAVQKGGRVGEAMVPVSLTFLNNGLMSVTLGDETFRPSKSDLEAVGEWATGVAEALGLADDQVVVGAWCGIIDPS